MTVKTKEELCSMCVYLPENLPAFAYSSEDYAMLKEKDCSYDFIAGSIQCMATRKTSCSVVDMENLMKQKKKGEQL